jgi:hypothetical protein
MMEKPPKPRDRPRLHQLHGCLERMPVWGAELTRAPAHARRCIYRPHSPHHSALSSTYLLFSSSLQETSSLCFVHHGMKKRHAVLPRGYLLSCTHTRAKDATSHTRQQRALSLLASCQSKAFHSSVIKTAELSLIDSRICISDS